jgi:hypothetical protein
MMPTRPLPSFYEPAMVRDVYVERAQLVAEAASDFKKKHAVAPASQDRVRIAAFGIDCQIGFASPAASLFVPSAVEDTTRTIEWLYRYLDRITQVAFSLDTHRMFPDLPPRVVDRRRRQEPGSLHEHLAMR